MSPCYPFRPIPGQCGPHRRGPLPAPPFDPQDYWATRKLVSSLFGSLETTKLDKVDVVDPSAKAEAGKAADAKSTYEELNRISGMASDAKEIAESKADKATTLAGYGITDAATKVELASKADLVDGKVPAAQLPSFVDDVLEYDAMSSFPATGEDGKIYIDKETNKTYRWSGTQYIEISQSLALGETESTAYPGDKGKVASETAFAAYNVANNMASAIVTHTENKSNPHAVTAAQVEAVPLVEDEKGNKTAVTIGSRVSDVPVGEGSLANGDTVIAYGRGSHAEGMNTVASGNYSHTDGVNTFAKADYSYAGGVHAGTKIGDEYAYAWNGDGLVSQYTSNGPGTFNINPSGGLNGFFIGEQTIAEVINVAIAGKADESELKDSVDALSREMDGKLSKSDVVAPSGDSRDGQAADAKVVHAELDSILSLADRAQTDANIALYDIGETKAALDNIKITAEDALGATDRLETNKADKSTTYTKAEADAKFREKADLSLDTWIAGEGAPESITGQPQWNEDLECWAWSWNTPGGVYESFRTCNASSPDDPGPIELYDELDIMSDRHFTATRDRIAKESQLTSKVDRTMISATNTDFSNAVLAVGLNIDTNSVTVLNEIAATFGGFPIEEGTATTAGGLLAALAAAIAWLKKNKVQTLKLEDDSVKTSAENGVAKLDDFFTESNSLLMGTIAANSARIALDEDGEIIVTMNTED